MRKYIASAVAGLLSLPAIVNAQLGSTDTGLTQTADGVYATTGDSSIGTYVGERILVPALSLVGVIFLVLMVYAGFLWMTAGGKPDNVQKAKDLMIRAVIGIIIISAAYAITDFIFDALG